MKLGILGVISAAIITVAGVSHAATFTSADVPKTIVDFGTVTSEVTVSGGAITDIDLLLFNVQHSSVADLEISLTSPLGTQVTIIESFPDNGIFVGLGTPDNFIDTIIDDQAATILNAGAEPFTGSFNVDFGAILAPLSVFNGESAAGVWQLTIRDEAGGDEGSLVSWGLEVAAVPLPAALPLMLGALGMLGVAGLRRRKVA